MSDLRIWKIEAGGLPQIQGKSGIQHKTPLQNTKIIIIIIFRIIKSMFTKTAKKTMSICGYYFLSAWATF